MSLVIAVIGSIAIAIILIQMLEAGLIPPGNRNPIVFGTFILLFFGTAFMYLNKHFNLMSAFKSQPQAKKGPPPKTVPAAKPAQAKATAGAKSLADQDLDEIAMRTTLGDDGDDAEAPDLGADGFESEQEEKKEKKKDKKKEDKEKANSLTQNS